MVQVILESWKEGLEKVLLTKLQINKLGIALKSAKFNVDSLLEGEKIIIVVESHELAEEFVNEASKIGVNCFISSDIDTDVINSRLD